VVHTQVLTYAWGALTGVFAFAVYYLFVQVRARAPTTVQEQKTTCGCGGLDRSCRWFLHRMAILQLAQGRRRSTAPIFLAEHTTCAAPTDSMVVGFALHAPWRRPHRSATALRPTAARKPLTDANGGAAASAGARKAHEAQEGVEGLGARTVHWVGERRR